MDIDESAPQGIQEDIWILTLEKNWRLSRVPLEGRAFWCSDPARLQSGLLEIGPSGGGAFWDDWSGAARGEWEKSLWAAAGHQEKEPGRIAIERRFHDEGFESLWVIRVLSESEASAEKAWRSLSEKLGLKRDSLLELPCSGSDSSFVGSSSLLWSQAIKAHKERFSLESSATGISSGTSQKKRL